MGGIDGVCRVRSELERELGIAFRGASAQVFLAAVAAAAAPRGGISRIK